MAIKQTITDEYHFATWINKQKEDGGSYGNNFSWEGAKAVQDYYDQLSDDLEEDIEFDPIAWCCEYSEYDSFEGFKNDTGWTDSKGVHEGYENIKTLDDLRDNTTVIEFDGGIIVGEF